MSAPGGLLLRGIRWRLALSILTVLTTTVAVAAAVLGPLYLHAAGDSVLRRVVSSAPVQTSGATLLAYRDEAHPLAAAARAESALLTTRGVRRLFGPPLETVEAGIEIPVPGNLPLHSELFARTSICHVLHLVAGRCDLRRGDVVMTAAGARQIHASVGHTITTSAAHGSVLRFTVAGIVSTPDLSSPYWWGAGRTDFPIGQGAASQGPAATDPLIASPATVLSAGARDAPNAIVELPVRRGAVGLGDEATVRAGLRLATARLQANGTRLGTGMFGLMANADHQRSQMTTIVAIAATQLVLLGMWVLGSLLVRSSDARRSEARVARLRGFPGRSMLWITAGEPGLLCLLGAVLGVALAWVATVIAKDHLFAPGSVVAFDGWSWGALALVFAAIVGALGAGARRLLRATDLADGAARRPGAASRSALVTDAVLVVLAVVALVALVTMGSFNGRSNPLASAAPGILALGIAVLAVQLILFACRLGISLSAGSHAVALGLALRQTARRPGVLRQARVLVIALCLACFATAAWSVARDNRATAARFEIGARRVVTVAPLGATRLQRAVDRADPRGRWAMAVVDLHASNATMLAVDAARLPATAAWPSAISHGQSVASVARTLDARAHPAVMLGDAPLQVTVEVTAADGVSAAQLRRQQLSAWVFTPAGGTGLASLGRLRPGRATYRAALTGLCAGGCRLAGLGIVPAPGAQAPPAGPVTLRVTQIRSGHARPLAADLVAGGWRSTTGGVTVAPQRGSVTITVSPAAITAAAGATGALSTPMAAPADHPRALPAVITSELLAFNAGAALTTDGLDGNVVAVRRSVTASALPRLGADAAMVDLGLLSRVQVAPTDPDAVDEVWLGPRAPADALARLRAAGLRATSVDRASAVLSALQRSGPALADDFLLVATLAALLIAAASTLGALGATTRERATELTSLEVAGVPRPALARSLALETVVLVLTASCGVGAGIVAAVVAMPSLPELTRRTLAPFRYGLPAIPIAVVAAVVIGLVALAAAGVAAVLLRRMSPVLLRNAPDDISG